MYRRERGDGTACDLGGFAQRVASRPLRDLRFAAGGVRMDGLCQVAVDARAPAAGTDAPVKGIRSS